MKKKNEKYLAPLEDVNKNRKSAIDYHSQKQIDEYKKRQIFLENVTIVKILLLIGLNHLKEGVQVSDIKVLLANLKVILADEEQRRPLIDALSNNINLKELHSLEFDDDLFEVLSSIFKLAKSKESVLEEKVNLLEEQLTHQSSFVEKIRNNIEKAAKSNVRRADDYAFKTVGPIIYELETLGFRSLGKIAKELNERKIATPTGNGSWYPSTVKLIRERIKAMNQRNLSDYLE